MLPITSSPCIGSLRELFQGGPGSINWQPFGYLARSRPHPHEPLLGFRKTRLYAALHQKAPALAFLTYAIACWPGPASCSRIFNRVRCQLWPLVRGGGCDPPYWRYPRMRFFLLAMDPAYSPVSSGCQGGFHTSTSANVSRYLGAADRHRTGAPALEGRCAAITPRRLVPPVFYISSSHPCHFDM